MPGVWPAMPEWRSAPVVHADPVAGFASHCPHRGRLCSGVLHAALRQDLLAELAAGSCTMLPEFQGGVRQQAQHRALTGSVIAQLPAVETLRQAVVVAVAAHADAVAELHRWAPDEVLVQRDSPGSRGILVHRDGTRYRHLVAIVILAGAAPFRLCTDRAGTRAATWNAEAGSLVLLRGPGLGSAWDGRPLHAVDGPRAHGRPR